MTKCAFAETRLRALVDGELDPGESRKVLAHLERCGRCREEYGRFRGVSSLLQAQELEEVPAHFSASLQVRLSGHRKARAAARAGRRRFAFAWPQAPRWRWASGTALALTATLCVFALSPRIGASEVARRAEQSWSGIRNYGCVFVSTGRYQGQDRVFEQRQFFRRAGDFRLETRQDYPLTTFVYERSVVHYLPGGNWEGKDPLVIVRPRTEGQNVVPFPFGVTWQNGGNVSLDQLVRQLAQDSDRELLGTEKVQGRDCYHLRFTAVPPGGRSRDQYELWLDTESFLPRKVSWYHDRDNHIVTEAKDLQVNYDVLPAGTFDFKVPGSAFVVRGDVDPHVLALPWERTDAYTTEPVATTDDEAWSRARSVPFPVFAPEWLPESYGLVRVRHKAGRWVDMHWIREEGPYRGTVLKLVQQDAQVEPPADLLAGEPVNLGTDGRPLIARMTQRSVPYRHVYLTWRQEGTRLTLFAAELSPAEVRRVARSLAVAGPPDPAQSIARHGRRAWSVRGEPSTIPAEPESSPAVDVREVQPEASSSTLMELDQPPMMPEMSDEDRMGRTRTEAGGGG